MSLKYSKNAVIKGFAGSDAFIKTGKFADDVVVTPEQRVNDINQKANCCRDWYEPIFANESKYLPVKTKVEAAVVMSAPKPPMTEENNLMNIVLLGLGIFVIYKLVS